MQCFLTAGALPAVSYRGISKTLAKIRYREVNPLLKPVYRTTRILKIPLVQRAIVNVWDVTQQGSQPSWRLTSHILSIPAYCVTCQGVRLLSQRTLWYNSNKSMHGAPGSLVGRSRCFFVRSRASWEHWGSNELQLSRMQQGVPMINRDGAHFRV